MHINISLRKVGPHKTRHVTVKCHLTGEIILLHVPDRTCAHRHATELTTIFWTNVLQHRRAWWCGQLLAVFNYKFSFCLSLPRGKGNDLWENNLQWSLQWSDKYGDVRLRDGARLRFIFSHSYRLALVSFNYGLNVAVPNVVHPPLPAPLSPLSPLRTFYRVLPY